MLFYFEIKDWARFLAIFPTLLKTEPSLHPLLNYTTRIIKSFINMFFYSLAYEIWILWLLQTFKSIIAIYRRSNFVYHNQGRTFSYPLRSLYVYIHVKKLSPEKKASANK